MSLPAGSIHPDFEAAPHTEQYRGELRNLPHCLTLAAPVGAKAHVVLPDGLLVALRTLPNGARQLIVGRNDREFDATGWMMELATIRRIFTATDWSIEHDETKAGGPKATFTETILTTDFFDTPAQPSKENG